MVIVVVNIAALGNMHHTWVQERHSDWVGRCKCELGSYTGVSRHSPEQAQADVDNHVRISNMKEPDALKVFWISELTRCRLTGSAARGRRIKTDTHARWGWVENVPCQNLECDQGYRHSGPCTRAYIVDEISHLSDEQLDAISRRMSARLDEKLTESQKTMVQQVYGPLFNRWTGVTNISIARNRGFKISDITEA